MARVIDTGTSCAHHLRSLHVFGRSPDQTDTEISHPHVSRVHCAIEWNGEYWTVRDVSKNGTWLNGRRLTAQSRERLYQDAVLTLGSPHGAELRLIDVRPPQSVLFDTSRPESYLAIERYVLIPSPDRIRAVLYFSAQEGGWLFQPLDRNGEPLNETAVSHGSILEVEGTRWQAHFAETEPPTKTPEHEVDAVSQFECHFSVSSDEENVVLKLVRNNDVFDLGERTHHYLLMHLARVRVLHAADGLDDSDQGWIGTDQLSKDLGAESNHVNILIHRARKQFSDPTIDPLVSECLIERLRGKVRFGLPRYKIFKGHKLVYNLPLDMSNSER